MNYTMTKENIIIKELNKYHASESKVKAIWEAANSGFKEGSPWTAEQFHQTLLSENAIILTAVLADEKIRDTEEIMALLIASKTMVEADIYMVVVAEAYKKRGLAKKIFEKLITLSIERNMETIFLEVRESNQAAYNLYQKIGFQEIGRRKAYYSSPIEDALMMKFDL